MYLELAFCSMIFCYLYFKKKLWHLEKTSKNVPGEPTLPLIGHAHLFMWSNTPSAILLVVKRLTAKYEGIMKFWFGPLLVYAIWEPSYVEIVANSPYTTNKGRFYYYIFGEVMNGVFVTPGGLKWRELRKPMTRTMNKKLLENDYMKVFSKKSNCFIDFIKKHRLNQEVNIQKDVGRLLVDILAETHLGIHLNELIEDRWKCEENFDTFLGIAIRYILRYHFYFWKIVVRFSRDNTQLTQANKKLLEFFKWILYERKLSAEEKNGRDVENYQENYPDFIMRRGADKKLTMTEMCKELGDLVIGGTDTTTIVVSSTLLFLAMFPDVQEKAYKEQISIFGASERDPTADDLAGMEYLSRVVKETLRLIAPPGVIKTAEGDISLGTYTIPKGAYTYIFINRLHHDERFWERPKDFYPDHFLPQNEALRPKYTFIPFGCGQRMCPGYQYGVNIVKTVTSSLIRQFKITTNMKFADILYDYKLLLHASSGYNLKFEMRNKI